MFARSHANSPHCYSQCNWSVLIAQRYLHGPVQIFLELRCSYLYGSDVNFCEWLPAFIIHTYAMMLLVTTITTMTMVTKQMIIKTNDDNDALHSNNDKFL